MLVIEEIIISDDDCNQLESKSDTSKYLVKSLIETNKADLNGTNKNISTKTNKFIFKEWDIKESDTKSGEELLNSDSTNKQNKDKYDVKIKSFRLGSFGSQRDSDLTITSDGLEFKIKGKIKGKFPLFFRFLLIIK